MSDVRESWKEHRDAIRELAGKATPWAERAFTGRRKRAAKLVVDGDYYHDPHAANRARWFLENCIIHVKGPLAGQKFKLAPWQWKDIIEPLYGAKQREDGLRRYRWVYVEIPRKSGKSFLGAGNGLYLMAGDGEPGADVYSVASDRSQAGLIFGVAKSQVEANPLLSEHINPMQRAIQCPESRSEYRVLSADARRQHGTNPAGVLFDELHTQPNRELFDALKTGRGARLQPVFLMMTTAGYDRNSVCWEQHSKALRVMDGTVQDESFLPVIYAADVDDDWEDPEVWEKANPNLGVSVSMSFLESEYRDAKDSPSFENTFRRLYLNQWVEQSVRFIPMDKWDACATPVDPDELEGADCFAGLDLASTQDITALVLVFPSDDGTVDVLCRFFVPEEGMRKRARRDKVPYEAWVEQGFMFATPGDVVDYEFIRSQIHRDAEKFNLCEIAFDRWNSSQLVTQLQDDGLTMVQFSQAAKSMSGPTREMLKLILEGKLNHGGHPVLRWMAGNLTAKEDSDGNPKPDKARSTEKIDGIVAMAMGLGRMIIQPDGKSVYEERGLLAL